MNARRLVSQLQPFPGMRHLDVAGGTGDVAFRVLNAIRAAESEASDFATSAHMVMHRVPFV